MLIELQVEFRIACEQDLPALEWMGLHAKEREIIRSTFDAQQRNEQSMLLGLANGFPVAQVWIDIAHQGTRECPRLWAIRVFPPLQGAGLGGALMDEAERLVAARGAEAVELGVEWTNPRAMRFYRRRGYLPVGREHDVTHYRFEGRSLTMEVDQQILRKPLRQRALGVARNGITR